MKHMGDQQMRQLGFVAPHLSTCGPCARLPDLNTKHVFVALDAPNSSRGVPQRPWPLCLSYALEVILPVKHTCWEIERSIPLSYCTMRTSCHTPHRARPNALSCLGTGAEATDVHVQKAGASFGGLAPTPLAIFLSTWPAVAVCPNKKTSF